jgi:hypothetical protein
MQENLKPKDVEDEFQSGPKLSLESSVESDASSCLEGKVVRRDGYLEILVILVLDQGATCREQKGVRKVGATLAVHAGSLDGWRRTQTNEAMTSKRSSKRSGRPVFS